MNDDRQHRPQESLDQGRHQRDLLLREQRRERLIGEALELASDFESAPEQVGNYFAQQHGLGLISQAELQLVEQRFLSGAACGLRRPERLHQRFLRLTDWLRL